jgi:cytochrome c553
MKKTIIALFALVAFAGTALAVGPESITLPAKNGNVTFTHKKHQDLLKDCSKCHAKAPGKIAELGKDWAHNTCKKCHTDGNKGPTKCGDCHKK